MHMMTQLDHNPVTTCTRSNALFVPWWLTYWRLYCNYLSTDVIFITYTYYANRF